MNPEPPSTIEPLVDAVTALWFGLLGGCVGSFLNVVAYRLPLKMSVVWKPSHCPHCQHAIRIRDNVPVLGWLLLSGRCRDCGQPIAARYAVVEFTLGLVFFLLAYAELFRGGANLPGGPLSPLTGAIDLVCYPNWPLIGLYAYHCALLSLLLAILLIDLDGHRAPLRLVLIGLALGLLPPIVWPWLHPTLAPVGPTRLLTAVDRIHVGLHLAASVSLGPLLAAGGHALLTQQRKSTCGRWNFVTALALVGAFLGWQAVLTTMAMIVAGSVVFRWLFVSRLEVWPNLRASASLVITLLATLIQIVGWARIASLLP